MMKLLGIWIAGWSGGVAAWSTFGNSVSRSSRQQHESFSRCTTSSLFASSTGEGKGQQEVADDNDILNEMDMDEIFSFTSEEDDQLEEEEEEEEQQLSATKLRQTKWDLLDDEIKAKIRKEGQQKAIANKKKREPLVTKKQRMMMYMKQQQQRKKFASRVERPMHIHDPNRISLDSLEEGQLISQNGTVISLTPFGAYVDVGTTGCDGLLHISQLQHLDYIEDGTFVEKVSDVLQPGDMIEQPLYVTKVSSDMKKLQLSLLSPEKKAMTEADPDDLSDADAITLEELEVDDEVWGEIIRVTKFGAYVDIGAVVPAWLHFMDHPDWGPSYFDTSRDELQTPSSMMNVGQRIRVWISKLDSDRNRIQLTGNRPLTLPQIRRQVIR